MRAPSRRFRSSSRDNRLGAAVNRPRAEKGIKSRMLRYRVARKTWACAALLLFAACGRREASRPAAGPSPAAKPFELDTTTPLKDPLPMTAARVNGHDVPTSQVVSAAETALRQGVVKDKIVAYRQALNQYVV